ncbi:MAG: hypothetical protein R3C27_02250 [Hyphomonadaceae bacterium]
MKMKPTQHSVKELRSIEQPNICSCRCDRPIPEDENARSRCSATSAKALSSKRGSADYLRSADGHHLRSTLSY